MSKRISNQFNCSKMMLPEHCGHLRRRADDLDQREKRRQPLIDEQLHEEQQLLLEKALAAGIALHFTLLSSKGTAKLAGIPRRISQQQGVIMIDTGEMRPLSIKAADVIALTLAKD